MRSREHRRFDRGWRLAAALLGIASLLVATIAVNLAELGAPWNFVLYVAVAGVMLVTGTLRLVPARRPTSARS